MRKETGNRAMSPHKETIVSEIQKDIPVIFLFSPNLLYIKSPKIKSITLKDVSALNERFLSIDKWFIETDKVWSFLVKND